MSGVEARLAEVLAEHVTDCDLRGRRGHIGESILPHVAAALVVVVAEEVTAACEVVAVAIERIDPVRHWVLPGGPSAVAPSDPRDPRTEAARIARAAAPPSSIGSGVGGQGGVGHERHRTGPVSDQEGFGALPGGQASPRRLCDEEKR